MKHKEPTKEQLKLMEDYTNVCSKVMDIIIKCENKQELLHASVRLQESMSWFHIYVINGGKLAQEN